MDKTTHQLALLAAAETASGEPVHEGLRIQCPGIADGYPRLVSNPISSHQKPPRCPIHV